MVPLEQLTQRVELAVADGEHECVVGALVECGFHGTKARHRFTHVRARMGNRSFEHSDHGSGTWVEVVGKNRRGRE
jgi:hypothetical protein